MNGDWFQLLRSMAESHLVFRDHAAAVRKRKGVKSVTHWSDLLPTSDQGVRFENYVSAEMTDGRAIDWCLELVITPEDVGIETAIEEISASGENTTLENGEYQYSAPSACAAEAIDIVRDLCRRCSW